MRHREFFPTVFACMLVAAVVAPNPDSTGQHSTSEQHRSSEVKSTNANNIPNEARLLKSDVIDNIECRLTSGFGAARDVGVVTVPMGEVTDFAVLSPSGTRFSGSLPFEPNWVRIGVSPDGSTVVGFADLRGGGGEFKPPDIPEPIRILRDNQTIFRARKSGISTQRQTPVLS